MDKLKFNPWDRSRIDAQTPKGVPALQEARRVHLQAVDTRCKAPHDDAEVSTRSNWSSFEGLAETPSDAGSTPRTVHSPKGFGKGSSRKSGSLQNRRPVGLLKVSTAHSEPQDGMRDAHADYERLELIGRSNAAVYKMRCRKTGDLRAAKVCKVDGIDPSKLEYRIMQSFAHPAIPTVFEFYRGTMASAFIMEYIDGGQTLEQLTAEGPLPRADCLRVIHELLEALAYVHEKGVIHFDICLDNIMYIPEDGRLCLIDWNIARKAAPKSNTPMNMTTVFDVTPDEPSTENQLSALTKKLMARRNSDQWSVLSSVESLDCGDYGRKGYRAPPMQEGSAFEQDVYATGVVLKKICTPANCPPEVLDVVQGLLAPPGERSSAQAALDGFDAVVDQLGLELAGVRIRV
jgi:serine/threonine protein kinase